MSEEKKSRNKTASQKKSAPKKSGDQSKTTLKTIWKYVWMCRGAIISIPVLVIAISLAFCNASVLPDNVGLNIQATGEYAMTVSRSVAVMIPLLVTFGCTLLATFTKRPLFPWLVSIFTLVLPYLILIVNNYPI